MQIDQRLERLRAFPERIERGIVQILPVGVAVDHGAAEFQVAHGAFELVRGSDGILHGKMGEPGITVRALPNFARQEIVGLAGIANGGGGVALGLHARPRQAENGARDAGAVHGFEPPFAEVGQAREGLLALGGRKVDGRRIPIVRRSSDTGNALPARSS